MRLYVFDLVEGAEEAEFGRGVLLSVAKWSPMNFHPRFHRFCREEDTYSIGQLAIRSDVKNEFRSGGLWIVGESGTLAHEVVLIDIPLSAGIGL